MKNDRFAWESDIISHIYEDNKNTVHFDYHVNIDCDSSIRLDLYTFNKRTRATFLLHQTSGKNSIEALQKMYDHIHKEKHDMAPYAVTWKKTDSDESHVSYFWEKSKSDVWNKFFYNKNEDEYIVEIELRPLA